jgi:hypothetical protein
MKTKHLRTTEMICFAAFAFFFAACLDLNLLDEMIPMDAGNLNQSLSQGAGDNESSGIDTGSSPPESNPADVLPPVVTTLQCGPKEREDQGLCIAEGPISASLRFSTDEPASVSVEALPSILSAVISEPWTGLHHAVAVDISIEETSTLTLVLADVNGNENRLDVSVKGIGGPPIVITEVLADPTGAEPNQEYVEIVNIGRESVDMSGWMIDDNGDKNGDSIPPGSVLESLQVALLAAPNFDSLSGIDAAPAADSIIIYLDGSIGSSGLKNSAAETIELYDAALTRVSTYDGSAGAPKEGVSASRLYAELPDGDPSAFAPDPNGSSTPGIATSLR